MNDHKLVPVDPNLDMDKAGEEALREHCSNYRSKYSWIGGHLASYKAMLAAAPTNSQPVSSRLVDELRALVEDHILELHRLASMVGQEGQDVLEDTLHERAESFEASFNTIHRQWEAAETKLAAIEGVQRYKVTAVHLAIKAVTEERKFSDGDWIKAADIDAILRGEGEGE